MKSHKASRLILAVLLAANFGLSAAFPALAAPKSSATQAAKPICANTRR
ncbi:MAG TPA: hypothetical protein VK747_03590 [Blastocatellia bacterium]|nr:hypothetical protein [Blastocatellia bacterium]